MTLTVLAPESDAMTRSAALGAETTSPPATLTPVAVRELHIRCRNGGLRAGGEVAQTINFLRGVGELEGAVGK